jgi:hypothetical protein
MCNQAVSLVAAEIERAGIPTTEQIFLREAAEAVRPPRALLVPFDHGYPLGEPNSSELQKNVLRQTFELLEAGGKPPVLEEYSMERHRVGAGASRR